MKKRMQILVLLAAAAGIAQGQPSVKEFGAVGDGATDDSAAFARAIRSLEGLGGALRIPKGIYNLGTAGITIPKTFGGIRLIGDSATASRLVYRGNGAAIQIGAASGFTYGHTISDLQIDLTGAGPEAQAIQLQNSLYISLVRVYLTSDHNFSPAVNRQMGIVAIGGDSRNQRFGAYLRIEDPRINGKFHKGIYLTAAEIGWGFNSCILEGGAIVYPGGPVAGTVGIHIEQGNQNVITLVDVEHFDVGIQSDAYANLFIGSRTEANAMGMVLTAPAAGITGGAFNRVVSGFHSDGIRDLSHGSEFVATTRATVLAAASSAQRAAAAAVLE